VVLDELRIVLLAGMTPTEMYQAVDNIVLTDVAAVPEPAGLAPLLVGLLGLGIALRPRMVGVERMA